MARADQRSCKLLHHPATERGLNLYHSLGAADRANCGGPTEPNTHSVIQGAREAILHVQPRSRLQTPLRLPKLPQRTLRFLIVSRLNFAHGADFSLHFAHARPPFSCLRSTAASQQRSRQIQARAAYLPGSQKYRDLSSQPKQKPTRTLWSGRLGQLLKSIPRWNSSASLRNSGFEGMSLSL